LMGGTIGFASRFGKGSSFWCKIPIDQGKCLI
jgi:signal transduction histidine kinase